MTAQAKSVPETDVDTAAEWFARRRSGQMSMQDVLELEVWLESDPDHWNAYKSVSGTWTMAHAVSTDPEILSMREAALARIAWRQRLFAAGSAAAIVTLLLTALYAAGFAGLWRDWFSPVSDQRIQTAVGQTVTVSLADGSTATLDSDTTLIVHETWRRRELVLEHGQAFFHVAKDPARPFMVSASQGSVTATGTAFDVRVDPDRLTVLLTEGRLHVELHASTTQPAAQTDMAAGWQLTASSGGEPALARLSSENQARELGWRTGRLAFVGESLSSVAAELNRYSLKKILVAPDLAPIPIDGVFRAGDIDGFVRLVVRSRLARVQNDTESTITLVPLKKTR